MSQIVVAIRKNFFLIPKWYNFAEVISLSLYHSELEQIEKKKKLISSTIS